MNKSQRVIKRFLPYALILAFSLFSTYILFYNGIPRGDDYIFHSANIIDKYTNLINGKSLGDISGNLTLGLGVGQTLFYSPIPHHLVAILGYIFSFFGCSLLTTFKFVLINTVFLSGVFMYRFGMHISKNNTICALIASTVYILYPYRLFDAFCRFAFAEAFVFVFIPLFLMGLYDIVNMNKDELSYIPFIEVILGGAFLYLTHNLTAILVFIVGIFYLLISMRRLFPLFKKPRFAISCASSVLLLIGIASIGMFSQLQLMGMNYYNLTNEDAMWTTPQNLITAMKDSHGMSGFLNLPWLYDNGVSSYTIIVGNVMFFISCLIMVSIYFSLEKLQKLKYWRLPIAILTGLILLLLFSVRLEAFLGYIIFATIYTINLYFISLNDASNEKKLSKKKAKRLKRQSPPKSQKAEMLEIFKHTAFWMSIFGILLAWFLMSNSDFWNIAPAFLRKIQFPWRSWSLVQICISVLACYLALHIKGKHAITLLAYFCGVLIVFSQPLLEKRVAYENQTYSWGNDFDKEALFDDNYSMGSCKEYCPVILTDRNYVSSYENSLCYQIREDLLNSFSGKEDYRYTPVFLTGNGEVSVSYAFAPSFEMEISASENGLIQMPLIYYPGYKIYLTNTDTNESIKIDGSDIDGLVSFEINKGNYLVKTAYEGTNLRKASFVIFPLSLSVVIGFGIYELTIYIKKNRNTKPQKH